MTAEEHMRQEYMHMTANGNMPTGLCQSIAQQLSRNPHFQTKQSLKLLQNIFYKIIDFRLLLGTFWPPGDLWEGFGSQGETK